MATDTKGLPTPRPGDPPLTAKGKMPPRRSWVWFVVVLVANFLLVRALMPDPDAPLTVPYTLFKEQAEKGNVQEIHSRGDAITGRFAAPITYPPAVEPAKAASSKQRPAAREQPRTGTTFTTTLPTFVDPGLEAFLIEHKVEISARPIEEGRGFISTLLLGFGPALLIIGLYVWMFRRAGQGGGMMGGGLMGIGKSKARRYDQE